MFNAIKVSDLQKVDHKLGAQIRKEKNPREKARMLDEQGAIRLVLRKFTPVKVSKAELTDWSRCGN